MARILLVEDDQQLAAAIVDALSPERHVIERAYDGLSAEYALNQDEFDLILLDWDLPRKSGIELLVDFRARGKNTPIIMLTGKASIDEKEDGLYSGADDYVTKPFDMRELTARIAAVIRRYSGGTPQGNLQAGDLVLDPVKYQLSRAGKELHLGRRDFALLEFFLRNPDHVFSAQTILTRVYGYDSEGSVEGLRSAIRRIRNVIDVSDDPTESLIENVARVGYRLRSR
ncbi:MAG: response regulator transcription factor [Terriglobales bacterium]